MPLQEYFVTIEVGTPPQTLEVVLATGSGDLFVFRTGACNSTTAGFPCEGGDCMLSLLFHVRRIEVLIPSLDDSSASSSYSLLSAGNFSIQYESAGSGVVGDLVSDNVAIGGITLNNLTFAAATQANETNTGIMGIGFAADETKPSSYNNFIAEMVLQQKISHQAFALSLGGLGT